MTGYMDAIVADCLDWLQADLLACHEIDLHT